MAVELLAICLAQLPWLAALLYVLRDRRLERRENTVVREMLLQRIQAPEAAVRAHEIYELAGAAPAPLPFDDDEAFHASREDMAAALAHNHP